MLQLRYEEQQKTAACDIEDKESQPQTDVAIERNQREIGSEITAYGEKHGDADGLGVERTVENAVIDYAQSTDEREEGDEEVVFLRCLNDRR